MRPPSLLSLALAGVCFAIGCGPGEKGPPSSGNTSASKQSSSPTTEALARGVAVPAEKARRPRFRQNHEESGLKVLPDGDLREWETAAGVQWIEMTPPRKAASSWSGPSDLQAKLALASYGGGVSMAVAVQDDVHQKARFAAAIPRADHVEVELWPGRRPEAGSRALRDRALGLHFRMGSVRQLVEVLRPKETWREAALSAAGAVVPGGYQVEARLPLSVLTPLPGAKIDRIFYRVTVYDADDAESLAEPTLAAEGESHLDPPLEVPEAVQRRASVRVCMAAEPEALWGHENGWRCSIPFERQGLGEDDAESSAAIRLGHSLLVAPPTLVWIRERLVFVNLAGVERGIVGLLDKRDTLLSVMRLGVIGAFDPGNTQAKDSDAEPMKLPDGTWAVAVTHSYPDRAMVEGGRCSAGHRIYLSILALRGCLVSTPFEPAPEPDKPPYLEEVFRLLLEDCGGTLANDWTLSKDRQTIAVHSSLHPSRTPQRYVYGEGRYRPAAPVRE
jgi:hypothetical protein